MMDDRGDTFDAVFGALSDPIRRGIIARLTRGPASVSELGAPYPVTAPAISKHLDVLERSKLIERWKVGRVRYCRLISGSLDLAADWLEQHKAFWERQLDSLEEFLEVEDEECKTPRKPCPQD